MSELRFDPLKTTWSVIAADPSRGPGDYIRERTTASPAACPLCSGNEEKTPPELFALRPSRSAPDTPGWQVRVIPHRYPALRIEGSVDRRQWGLYESMAGVGAHEVIVETPEHGPSLADLSLSELAGVLQAYRARLLDLRRDRRFRTILVFKNHGPEAGATIAHSHSQLIAVPITPPAILTELGACRSYFADRGRCLKCDLLEQERREGGRIIRDDGAFVVYAPYASSFPFEFQIAPVRHGHDFGALSDSDLEGLAAALGDGLRRMRRVLHDPPYNFVLHTAPPETPRPGHPEYWQTLSRDFHWHIEVVPRLTRIAGFEWGTGFHINPTPPEAAAGFLRAADGSASL